MVGGGSPWRHPLPAHPVFIGAVFAYLTYTQWRRKRILFMLWAIVMPLIAN